MILLDPGSIAFDFPDNNGYKLLFKNLEEYANGMSLPSWHQWISYETKNLDKELITEFTIDSIDDSINLREQYGIYDSLKAEAERYRYVTASKEIISIVDNIMAQYNENKE